MRLFRTLILTPVVALAFAGAAQASDKPTDICPDVVIDPEARNATYYPGGEPGRNKRDYSHIAVILQASATCVEDRNDQIFATVTISYAVEAGPLYRGSATVKVKGEVVRGGAMTAQDGSSRELVIEPGTPATFSGVIERIAVGEDDDVEDGLYTIKVGLER